MKNVKAVLFDLDGTLVDSLPEIYEGVCRTAADFGVKPPSKDEVGAMIGRGVVVLVDRLYAALGLEEESVSRQAFLTTLVNHWSETNGRYIAFYPGVLDGIRALRSAGVMTALVTNKLRSLTLKFIEERGIAELFSAVVAGDDCERNKPAPDMLWRALEELGVEASDAVMVGDSRNDALAARAAGVTAALVETGYNEGVGMAEWAREAGFTKVYPSAKKVCDQIVVKGTL